MTFTWVFLGSILSTAVLLGIELAKDDLRLALVALVLIIVLVREHLSAKCWYKPFFLIWLGVTFLVADWLQIASHRGSVAAFVTFGPCFLVIGLYEIVRHHSASPLAKTQ